MNSKNPKRWESLMNDANFESKMVQNIKNRYKKEQRTKRTVASVAMFVVFFGVFLTNEYLVEPYQISNNLDYLIEELSTEYIVSL
ncbi:hypothetical protein P3G55_08510 [Leptospira sp. 96542]|nr:hypothetical protein [Leptospira sp. 96542]